MSEHSNRILVVEDDRSVGKVVEVSLGLAGHEVELATDDQSVGRCSCALEAKSNASARRAWRSGCSPASPPGRLRPSCTCTPAR
mgnify:CR=1 FL=1